MTELASGFQLLILEHMITCNISQNYINQDNLIDKTGQEVWLSKKSSLSRQE